MNDRLLTTPEVEEAVGKLVSLSDELAVEITNLLQAQDTKSVKARDKEIERGLGKLAHRGEDYRVSFDKTDWTNFWEALK